MDEYNYFVINQKTGSELAKFSTSIQAIFYIDELGGKDLKLSEEQITDIEKTTGKVFCKARKNNEKNESFILLQAK